MKILVIGFKPFATHKTNPSETVLGLIKNKNAKTLLLDVSYEKAKKQFLEALEKEKPDFVLGLGLSPFRANPTFEQYAYNEMDSVQPDEDGVVIKKTEIVPGGPKSIPSSFDTSAIHQYVTSQGFESSISIDPGRFVFNEVFYLSLNSGAKSLFLHIPEEFKFTPEESAEVVECLLEYLEAC